MSITAPLPSTLPALRAAAARGRGLAAWWIAGARATVPPRWIAAWTGPGRPALVVSRGEGRWTCVRLGRGGAEALDLGPSGFTPDALAAWLAAGGLARDAVDLAVALPRDDLFLRPLTLPEAALPRLGAILDQEIVRRTPFAAEEVWHGGEVLAGSGPLRAVHHWIVRRDLVRRALASLGLDEAGFDAVAVAEAAGPPRPVIPLRAGAGAGLGLGLGPAPSRLLRGLALAALLATGLAVAAADAVEGLRAGRIADALAEARSGAEAGTAGGRALRSLLSIKALPGLGVSWAELSRIVPDDTFLTELRLEDGSFTARGFSSDAVALPRIVDGSPLFTAAALTGGIEPNAEWGRDQFGLAFDLRAKPPRKARAAAGVAP